MNKVIAAANEIVGKILPKDIAVDFRYENCELTYVIRDIHGDLLFKYIGQLVNNKPHGKGIAYYPDGDYYEGSFRDGNRHGKGILRDSNRKILQNGYWKYEEYVEDTIRFYKNLKAAAGSIKSISDIQEIDYEPINIPGIKGDNIFAFPIEGNSMEPNFFEGDIVICKQLDSSEEIQDQKIYVIFHEGGLVVKRVKKAILESGNQSFKLISDNYCDYSPYIITPTNESKFFKILMHVKPFTSPPSP